MKLLQQVRIVDPTQSTDRLADVSIVDGQIKEIAEQIRDYPPQAQIIPQSGLILGTGLVDLYSHSGEPGNESRETLLELACSATAGGFTQVGILPDTTPAIDNRSVLEALKLKCDRFNLDRGENSQLNFWGAANESLGGQMSEIGELHSGVIGLFTRHNFANLNALRQLLEYVRVWQLPVAIACQQNELAGDGVVREGAVSVRQGMLGNPGFSETAAIAAIIEIVAEIPTPVHLMRVSTARGVELIADAKERGLKLTASTSWMHLLWDNDDLASYDSNLRLDPPLGTKADRTALIDAVRQGIIDAIAIDHQAYTYEEKTVPFAQAPPGAIGLELALPLLWQKLVVERGWSAIELWQALSSRPLECLNRMPYSISVGQPANLVLFDSEQTWIADRSNLKSPASNTPWYGQQIKGKVIRTWTNLAFPESSSILFNPQSAV